VQATALALVVALAMPPGRRTLARQIAYPAAYPEIAKRMRISGMVRLAVTVDRKAK